MIAGLFNTDTADGIAPHVTDYTAQADARKPKRSGHVATCTDQIHSSVLVVCLATIVGACCAGGRHGWCMAGRRNSQRSGLVHHSTMLSGRWK